MNGSIDTATFGWLWPVIPSHAHARHIYQTGLATDASRRLTWLKEDLEAVRGNTVDDGHCKIRGIRKVHQIITTKPNGVKAYSSSLLHAIIVLTPANPPPLGLGGGWELGFGSFEF